MDNFLKKVDNKRIILDAESATWKYTKESFDIKKEQKSIDEFNAKPKYKKRDLNLQSHLAH